MSNFRFTKIIEKKRNGEILLKNDIEYFVTCVVNSIKKGASQNESADRSQIGAMLMAIYLKGLDHHETLILTESMKNSGYVFSWPKHWRNLVVDKHSTGGVGDKVSLVLAPTLAALGLKVPMISGRSLGHTGGTLDKLESIPGYRVDLSKEEIYTIVETVGCCIVGQTDDCVPADKVLYHCRDLTATTDCPELIVASIVSKKLSVAPHALVYDVKYGKGSIFKSKQEAIDTAKKLVGASRNIATSALLSSMENPLGQTIGNSLEVIEAIECLKGRGPQDVLEVTSVLGSEILRLGKVIEKERAQNLISTVLKEGQALEKFKLMLIHQGVSKDIAQELCHGDAESILLKGIHTTEVLYNGADGYIQEIDPLVLSKWWKEEFSTSLGNFGVGIKLLKVVEDRIKTGEPWARMYHHTPELKGDHLCMVQQAITVLPQKCTRLICSQIIE